LSPLKQAGKVTGRYESLLYVEPLPEKSDRGEKKGYIIAGLCSFRFVDLSSALLPSRRNKLMFRLKNILLAFSFSVVVLAQDTTPIGGTCE
jgi:hypothetical protein